MTVETVAEKTEVERFKEVVSEDPIELDSRLENHGYWVLDKTWLGEVALRLVNGNGSMQLTHNPEAYFTKQFRIRGGRWPKKLTAVVEGIELLTGYSSYRGMILYLKVLNVRSHSGENLFQARSTNGNVILKGRYGFNFYGPDNDYGIFKIIDEEELKTERKYPYST